MNNPRRKKLNTILEQLIKIHAALEEVKDEEQDYFDNIPENLRNSERYDKAENAVAALEDALSMFDEIADNIEVALE
jgi:hypothetical protein